MNKGKKVKELDCPEESKKERCAKGLK